MISSSLRIGVAALALAATLGTASQASAFPILHGPVFPGHHGPFGPGHFPGGWNGPHWGGPHFGGPYWGGRGFGFGVGFYPRPVVYGGCYVKRFIDDDGDLVIRKICE